ncbi:MAG: outer membrane beta-barrel protein [candidate division Zixibacteria bacterium]|nr:outer membrane beta-barrel protein [candidate division Zixibacteria bacterium]
MFGKITTGVLLGILSLLPLTARSQTSVYVGPHLGIQKSQDAEDASYLVGATLRLKLMPILGVEGDIGYRQEKYGSGALTVKNWPVTVTGLLYPLPIIYGGIGGGWYNSTLDYSDAYNQAGFDDDTATKFGWHLVVGIELPASPSFSLFGDIRYVFLDYKFKKLPGAVLDGAKANFYSINVGLLFHL